MFWLQFDQLKAKKKRSSLAKKRSSFCHPANPPQFVIPLVIDRPFAKCLFLARCQGATLLQDQCHSNPFFPEKTRFSQRGNHFGAHASKASMDCDVNHFQFVLSGSGWNLHGKKFLVEEAVHFVV